MKKKWSRKCIVAISTISWWSQHIWKKMSRQKNRCSFEKTIKQISKTWIYLKFIHNHAPLSRFMQNGQIMQKNVQNFDCEMNTKQDPNLNHMRERERESTNTVHCSNSCFYAISKAIKIFLGRRSVLSKSTNC